MLRKRIQTLLYAMDFTFKLLLRLSNDVSDVGHHSASFQIHIEKVVGKSLTDANQKIVK